MKTLKKTMAIICQPRLLLHKINGVILERFASLFGDELYLKLIWKHIMGYSLNLENPKTFNEKLQWLKIHDRRPEYTQMVDKYEAKKYVSSVIGEEYIIPTLGIFDSVDDIDFDALPDQFVLKCTHDSGGIVICKDKKNLDVKQAIKKLRNGLKQNFYYRYREWPYKNVKPRIIAEKYMEDESGWQLKDYKIFCFNGEPGFIEVDYDRYVGHKLNVYDLNWQFIDFYMTSPNDINVKIEKPKQLNLMLDKARQLSKGIPFVRVDFYSINDNIYFGELTFHPGSGLIDFHPREYDKIVGEKLALPIESDIK